MEVSLQPEPVAGRRILLPPTSRDGRHRPSVHPGEGPGLLHVDAAIPKGSILFQLDCAQGEGAGLEGSPHSADNGAVVWRRRNWW